MSDSFHTRATLQVGAHEYTYHRLDALGEGYDTARLPYALKVLLENLLRHEDGVDVTREHIEALAGWKPGATATEIAFTPARVLLQDFTGVPSIVDLAAMRDAMENLGGDPARINPLSPVELVIDHSLQIDHHGKKDAMELNAALEFSRNRERYAFLRWGQQAFSDFKVVPPDTGIVHQVNLEYLARVVFAREAQGHTLAFPDTVVGKFVEFFGDGLDPMLIPEVVGFRLTDKLPEGATATDLVLTVVQMLREKGVVGKFVEFFGDGLDHLPLADRATIANMAPEYGATCGIFPVDSESLRYLRLSGREESQVALVEAYAKAQGMYRQPGAPQAHYSDLLELDMSTVMPSISGPKRPQDRIGLRAARNTFGALLETAREGAAPKSAALGDATLKDGAVVIAAITSCTNTSNPAVMMAAGLLARNAVARGLSVKPWVKTSLAPGSQVVSGYLQKAGLMDDLAALGFHLVGYGCTTCIGNSGPLDLAVSQALQNEDIIGCAVLSGNRNFEGRIHADVRMNFLASPPLVVAYALAGTMDFDMYRDPLGTDRDGNPVFLKDLWPAGAEINECIQKSIDADVFRESYRNVFAGDRRWQEMDVPSAGRFQWQDDSTYVQHPPYFEGMTMTSPGSAEIRGARVLALLGDSITTDHISPAGAIKADSPAGNFLTDKGVAPADFNSYGARRGNHEVMMRGTFANVRLRNLLAPGTEGGFTRHQPSGEQMSIYDASLRYKAAGVPLLVIGGKEYGTGSSRDWAAKGTLLLGAKAVLVASFERIHRSNLVGMGVLPLEFMAGEDARSLGLDGTESYDITGLAEGVKTVQVTARGEDGSRKEFTATVRIDTPKEWSYYTNGGILHYVLRQLAA